MSLLAVAATLLVAPVRVPAPAEAVSRYDDLVQLFTEIFENLEKR